MDEFTRHLDGWRNGKVCICCRPFVGPQAKKQGNRAARRRLKQADRKEQANHE